ncbi:hypothetical protein BKA67DRAFT_126415 [Truncatella angustata]|uniref:Uncharacterized protein n=1 Tax=Truncatella angustata TaxID=152316 RepID=A0A9P8UB54_9PEZI|nr:uncharacterized protein BKA67DRAFT_126415 [Truncatella angustata]KAH6644991.1 hypothetical protein BKA67DRAFT_126415 [Truncatella angustata]
MHIECRSVNPCFFFSFFGVAAIAFLSWYDKSRQDKTILSLEEIGERALALALLQLLLSNLRTFGMWAGRR